MNSTLILSQAEIETGAIAWTIRHYREALGLKYLTHESFYALATSYGHGTLRMMADGNLADVRFYARLAFRCANTALDTHANRLATR